MLRPNKYPTHPAPAALPDLVSVVTPTANTTGQAFEALLILILVYLAINLGVSALMNLYNRRVALRGEAST